MKRLFQASLLVSLILVGMSAFPGAIESVFSGVGVLTALPVLCGWLLCVAIGAARDWNHGRPFPASFGLLSAILVVATGALVWLQVPRRVVFAISRPGFDAVVRAGGIRYEDERVARRLGYFSIDAIRRDGSGGVYFRTRDLGDGPDTLSFGFAYRPDPTTSPFGASGYRLHRLSRDWYSFSVSDDYY